MRTWDTCLFCPAAFALRSLSSYQCSPFRDRADPWSWGPRGSIMCRVFPTWHGHLNYRTGIILNKKRAGAKSINFSKQLREPD
jgi:hypothetical protein